MITIDQAYDFLSKTVAPLPSHIVKLEKSVGRVLATSVIADVDSPPHRKSLMDGFAVRSADINANVKRLNVIETIVAGGWPSKPIRAGEASRIMTGSPLPEGADAVVMIEKCSLESNGDDLIVVIELDQLEPAQHVVDRAHNFKAGQVLFPSGHRIRPSDIGLLAESGAAQVIVSASPTVAILPTGNELVECHQRPARGQIRNSNGPMLAALSRQLGLATTQLPICPDDGVDLALQASIGLQHDLLILSGGVSEGLLDLVPQTLQRLGVEEVFHKVRIKPGKPIWYGIFRRPSHAVQNSPKGSNAVCNAEFSYVFGLPGNPVSGLVGFHLFVRAAIRLLEGQKELAGQNPATDDNSTERNLVASTLPQSVPAILTKDQETRGDRPTYWPGRIERSPSASRRVEPLTWRGSSDLLALGQADGLIYFSGRERLTHAGSEVHFFPF